MVHDAENLFICLFTIHVPSVMRCLYTSFACVNWMFVFMSFNFKNSLYILNASPLSNTCLANIFPSSMACLFISWSVCFTEQAFLILIKYNLSFSSFIDYAFGVISKNSLPSPGHETFTIHTLCRKWRSYISINVDKYRDRHRYRCTCRFRCRYRIRVSQIYFFRCAHNAHEFTAQCPTSLLSNFVPHFLYITVL